MALPHAASGDVINILPLGEKLAGAVSTALLKTEHLELMRLVLPAGKTMPQHWVEGEVTIQCLEGSIELDAQQNGRELKQVLHAGELVYLAGGVPHSLRALENASVLMTILLHRPDSTGGPAR